MKIVGWTSLALAGAVLWGVSGCARPTSTEIAAANNAATAQIAAPVATAKVAAPPVADLVAESVHFKDVTAQSGLNSRHFNGAFGAALLPETMGSGCAVFDYNGDGLPDIFIVNGRAWTPHEVAPYQLAPMGDFELQIRRSQAAMNVPVARLGLPAAAPPASHNALYRNNGDGTFTDVIKGSGLDVQSIGMGAAAADYDGDGRSDLCLTAYGQLFLFRNDTGADGRPRFRDVSQKSGVNNDGWSTSAAFFDYDRDGKLDLFVCRYAQYTPARDVYRSLDQHNKSYGWPKDYPSQTSLLFHNLGGGRFENVSAKAGISRRIEAGKPTDKPIEGAALGVAVCDPNGDGWPDLIVANDLRANFYFVNQKNGTFADEAAKNGLAIGPEGKPRGGMGIDVADVDHSGKSSVVVGHFNAEGLGFWQSAQAGFQEVAAPLGIRDSSFTSLTFGLLFADLNNDGWPDLIAANGHVDPTVHNYLILVHYHQRPLLYLNETRVPGTAPKFVEVGEAAGLTQKLVARGLVSADFNGDGNLDLLFTTNDELPHLYFNQGTSNRALRVTLRGKAPNTDAIGARVEARVGTQWLRRDVRSGSSYLSQSELPVTLGLGQSAQVDELKVTWPDGSQAKFPALKAGQSVKIVQGQGIVARAPFKRVLPASG